MSRISHTFSCALLIFCCLFMSACGNLLDSIEDDSRFTPIKRQFEKDALFFGIKVNAENVKISFGDTDKDMKYAGFITVSKGDRSNPDGYCQILQSSNDIASTFQKMALGKKYNTKVIVVSDKYQNSSLDFLETLVYHELGHCLLNYAHRKESVMDSDVSYMGAYRYFWLREFFTRQSFPENIFVELKKVDMVKNNLIPIFKTDYSAFGQKIYQELYFDPEASLYYSIDNSTDGPHEM